jgi:uncharacterized repeat protein (TIGR03803 family)
MTLSVQELGTRQRAVSVALMDSKGDLFGTTVYGGSRNYGVVWEITPQ